jgi:recombination protein RecA
MFGSPETTTGGRALKFYSSVRIDVRRQEVIKLGDTVVGHHIKLKAVKNKVGTPLRETVVDLYYPKTSFKCGFDVVGDLITFASKRGMFEMSGSWYSMDMGNIGPDKKPLGVERIANGIANLKEALRDNPVVLDKLRKQVLKLAAADTEVKI